MTKSSTPPLIRLCDRFTYRVVRRLVQLSYVFVNLLPVGDRGEALSSTREIELTTIMRQLQAEGFLRLGESEITTIPEHKSVRTGSSMNVAMIPGGENGEALVVKFTDSVVASAELVISSQVQEHLGADPQLSSWSVRVPKVLASGVVGTTTFAVEECLSSRDGRMVRDDPISASALIEDALVVIEDFHRVYAKYEHIDAGRLEAIVDRPVQTVRENTTAGFLGRRSHAIDRLTQWLRRSLIDQELECGWSHGDYHLGNVLVNDNSNEVVGIIDWGRAESDGLTLLDGFTLIIFERAVFAGEEIGSFVLELLRDVTAAYIDRSHPEVLVELRALLIGDSEVDLRCLLILTWLKHVANNLRFEDRARAHGLWRLRTVDLVLYGAVEIIGC